MANYLDHLLAVDEYTRSAPAGCVQTGYEMHAIAQGAGLVEPGNLIAANWTGQLVELEYLVHGAQSAGDRRPLLPGRMWSDSDLQRFSEYRVTARGREEADRMRRLTREAGTDAALDGGFPYLAPSWMSDDQRRAVLAPLATLRSALDSGDGAAAVGAAKNLIEAACKIRIEHAGGAYRRGDSLTNLFKAARETGEVAVPGEDLARSLNATVQRMAELRNAVGAGHGQASAPALGRRDARLAAGAATSVAAYLLMDG
jgi:hypothetical protein